MGFCSGEVFLAKRDFSLALKEMLAYLVQKKPLLYTTVLDNFHPVFNFPFLRKVIETVFVYSCSSTRILSGSLSVKIQVTSSKVYAAV